MIAEIMITVREKLGLFVQDRSFIFFVIAQRLNFINSSFSALGSVAPRQARVVVCNVNDRFALYMLDAPLPVLPVVFGAD
jgi:hypothetical protein